MTMRTVRQEELTRDGLRSVSITGSGAYVICVFECRDAEAATRALGMMRAALATDDIHFVIPRAAVTIDGAPS